MEKISLLQLLAEHHLLHQHEIDQENVVRSSAWKPTDPLSKRGTQSEMKIQLMNTYHFQTYNLKNF